jgi:DNA-binding NtrC family response regulator
MLNVLIVDDDSGTQIAMSDFVEHEGFTTRVAATLREAREQVAESPPDVVLIDLMLPDGAGLELLPDLVDVDSSPEVVVITGHASIDSAVEALRMGAADYLTKPLDLARLKAILAHAERTRLLKNEVQSLRAELRTLGRFGLLRGSSPSMHKVYDLIGRVAPTDASVMIVGESGTGKDLVAQTIHDLSTRRSELFLPLNCGSVSPGLIESELFGHEKGSFTGADRQHKGCFERANRGTLFLDEITEMPIELQVKLLRVLETGVITRLGGERTLNVDVRVVAATNRQPDEAVAQGKLREDLLYRLQVFPIHLPPLRERGRDVELLAVHFLSQLNEAQETAKKLSARALESLRNHAWPGNVRELKNVIQRAFILADDEIDMESLPQDLSATPDIAVESAGPFLQIRVGKTSLAEAEKRLILATLNQFEGDKNKTSTILGTSLKTLYNRLNSYKMDEQAATLPSLPGERSQ